MLPVYPSHEYPSQQHLSTVPNTILSPQQTWNPLAPQTPSSQFMSPSSNSQLFQTPNSSNIRYFDSYNEKENFANDTKGKILISSFTNDSVNYTQKERCPLCLKGFTNFHLPNDTTNTVYCNDCRNPYHFCPIHKKTIPGIGYSSDDPERQYKCQCNTNQSFLNHQRWDQCFNN